jgi:hypothetical protein
MRRVSSRWTFFYKRVFPILWCGILILVVAVPLFKAGQSGNYPQVIPFLIVPTIMLLFGLSFMKKFVFDLVDEVWDDGDALLVRNRGQEERINLADIKNVSGSPLSSPPRITLSLRRPSVFGDRVTFCGPVRFIPFAANPVIDELIDRIDRARESSRRR